MIDSGDGDDDGRAETPAPAEIGTLVDSLIGMMHGGNISELDVAFGSVSIRLRGRSGSPRATSTVPPVADGSDPGADPPAANEHRVTAPMIGTFYTSPSPGAPPFVAAGDDIETGQTIGIIEAMKIMNEITADRTGHVVEVLVGNGQPVEYGSPLIRLMLDGDSPA